MQLKDQLLAKIENRTACIGVVGLGYVGLPLGLEFAKAGFKVIGYDVSDRVVRDRVTISPSVVGEDRLRPTRTAAARSGER